MSLPEGMEVLSTFLGEQPVKPSKDEAGRLMLPLMRSSGGDHPEPFTIQVVLEGKTSALGWFGAPKLLLPSVDLPVSSLAWSVYLPARNTYSGLRGDVGEQGEARDAGWFQPAYYTGPVRQGTRAPSGLASSGDESGVTADPSSRGEHTSADTGAMPVRIHLPETGVRLETSRYWIEANQPVQVGLRFIRTWLLGPIGFLLVLAFAGGLLLLASGASPVPPRRASWAGAAIVLWTVWPLVSVGGFLAVLGASVLALFVLALRRGWLGRLASAVPEWFRTLPIRFKERARPERGIGFFGAVYRIALAGAMLVLGAMLFGSVASLIALLGRPLSG
jgi:hypothetical protein